MYLIQILLPLYDGAGRKVTRKRFDRVKLELTERFGGVTAYTHSPAEGHWKTGGKTARDAVISFEVMSGKRDTRWWKQYRSTLEDAFRQDRVIVRSVVCNLY